MRMSTLPFFLVLTIVALPARADGPAELEVYEPPVRAVDVFKDAHLLEIPPALTAPPEPVVLLEEGFEADALDDGWTVRGQPRKRVMPAQGRPVQPVKPRAMRPVETMQPVESKPRSPVELSPSASREEAAVTVEISGDRAHGGKSSLRVAASAATVLPRLERTIAVEPRTSYRLTGFVRAAGLETSAAGASIELVEVGADPAGAVIVDHQHLPRERGTSVDWRRLSYVFRTSAATRHVRIILRAATGRAKGAAFFDHVTLVKIPRLVGLLDEPSFASTIREAKPHPLLKRRRFGDHDERPAILAPVPTRWRLGAALEEDTLLRFALGVEANPAGATKACFRILFRGNVENVLFERCLEAAGLETQPGWLPFSVDLGEHGGETGELIFETFGQDGDLAFWGNPRLLDRQPGPDAPPNIVVITIDTLRADHLGSAGYERPTSPALDALARRSVRFPRAYAPSPWTAPSIASLMTGRYPAQHLGGARAAREQRERDPASGGHSPSGSARQRNAILGELFRRATALRYHPILPQTPTLAERLRAAGFDTVGFHSNFNSSGALGLSRGFDQYQMFSGVSPSGAGAGVSLARRFLIDRAAQGENGPFFLLFHTQDPHVPYRLRDSLAEIFDTAADDSKESGGSAGKDAFRRAGGWATEFWDWRRLRRGQARGEVLERVIAFYDSEIAWADKALGFLLEELEKWPDTVILVTADHGEEFGEHGQFEHGHSLYDEVLRVPLFVRLPGDRHAGTVVEDPVSLVDVAPTLLDLAGVDPLEEAEGRSLFAVGRARERPRGGLFAQGMLRGTERTGLIAEGYKYIYNHPRGYLDPFPVERKLERGITEKTGSEELYRLDEDPAEEINLATRAPEVLGRMRERVAAYLAETAPGVHLRCRAPAELELASTATLSHVEPLFGVVEDDEIEIAASERRGVVRLAPGEGREAWLVLRFFEPEARLTLRARSSGSGALFFLGGGQESAAKGRVTVELGDDSLVAVPEGEITASKPWCRVWQVRGAGPASSRALDSEIVEQLRALGYL